MNKNIFGLLWLFVEKFSGTLISTATFLVYSFYLSPSELGEATFALSVALIFSQTAVTVLQDPIVCAPKLTKVIISSCIWFNVALATIIIFFLCIAAEIFAEGRDVARLVQVSSIVVLISALSSLYAGVLRRQKKFKQLAFSQMIGRIVGACVGVVFVIHTGGPFALVLQLISIEFFALMALVMTFRLKIRKVFKWRGVRALLFQGVPIAAKKVSWESFAKGVPVVLGLTLSPAQVGLFAFAWRIVDMPRAAIHSAALSFILPMFSSNSKESSSILSKYLLSTKLLCILTTPFFLMLALFAEPLILLVFNDKWRGAAPLVSLLSVVPLLANFRIFAPSLFTSLNLSKLGTKTDIASTAVSLLICAILASTAGAVAGVIAFIVRMLVNLPITMIYLKKLVGINWRDYVSMYSSTVIPALLITGLHFSGILTMKGPMLLVQFFIELLFFLFLFWLLEEQKYEFLQKVKLKS